MKKKRTDCKYCGKELDAKTTRKEFCSNKCRVYWNRENPVVQITDATKPTNEVKPPEQPKTNYSINTEGVKKPRNLAELRAMMPPDLDQWGKTEWMQIQRKKYGI